MILRTSVTATAWEASRLCLGALFVLLGLTKLLDYPSFLAVMDSYGVFPSILAPFFALAVPVVEVTLGCLLFARSCVCYSSFLLCLLVVSFSGLKLYFMLSGSGMADCGCSFVAMPLTRSSLLADLVYLGFLAFTACCSPSDHKTRARSTNERLLSILAVMCIVGSLSYAHVTAAIASATSRQETMDGTLLVDPAAKYLTLVESPALDVGSKLPDSMLRVLPSTGEPCLLLAVGSSDRTPYLLAKLIASSGLGEDLSILILEGPRLLPVKCIEGVSHVRVDMGLLEVLGVSPISKVILVDAERRVVLSQVGVELHEWTRLQSDLACVLRGDSLVRAPALRSGAVEDDYATSLRKGQFGFVGVPPTAKSAMILFLTPGCPEPCDAAVRIMASRVALVDYAAIVLTGVTTDAQAEEFRRVASLSAIRRFLICNEWDRPRLHSTPLESIRHYQSLCRQLGLDLVTDTESEALRLFGVSSSPTFVILGDRVTQTTIPCVYGQSPGLSSVASILDGLLVNDDPQEGGTQ